jgi:hypothetical protein
VLAISGEGDSGGPITAAAIELSVNRVHRYRLGQQTQISMDCLITPCVFLHIIVGSGSWMLLADKVYVQL